MGEEGSVSKLVFEPTADFKFKAAYEAYSMSFDRAPSVEERRRLNETIAQLFRSEISYPQFYGEIGPPPNGSGRGFPGSQIRGLRKRDYRREEQKKERIRRHKR